MYFSSHNVSLTCSSKLESDAPIWSCREVCPSTVKMSNITSWILYSTSTRSARKENCIETLLSYTIIYIMIIKLYFLGKVNVLLKSCSFFIHIWWDQSDIRQVLVVILVNSPTLNNFYEYKNKREHNIVQCIYETWFLLYFLFAVLLEIFPIYKQCTYFHVIDVFEMNWVWRWIQCF